MMVVDRGTEIPLKDAKELFSISDTKNHESENLEQEFPLKILTNFKHSKDASTIRYELLKEQ